MAYSLTKTQNKVCCKEDRDIYTAFESLKPAGKRPFVRPDVDMRILQLKK
jgi:hypothetical protein